MPTQEGAARMRAWRAESERAERERAEESVARTVGLSDLADLVLHVERLHPRGTGAVLRTQLEREIVLWAIGRFGSDSRPAVRDS